MTIFYIKDVSIFNDTVQAIISKTLMGRIRKIKNKIYLCITTYCKSVALMQCFLFSLPLGWKSEVFLLNNSDLVNLYDEKIVTQAEEDEKAKIILMLWNKL